MNNRTDNNIQRGEPIEADAPEMQILASDAPTDLDKHMAAQLGVQLPPPPITGPASELMSEGRNEFGQRTSYIGQVGEKLLNLFLSKHKSEWESLQEEERDKKQTAGKFQFYASALAALKQKEVEFRGMVNNAKAIDFPQTLFENVFKIGHPVEMLFSAPHSTQILTAFFLQAHGDAVLKKIEDEIGAVQAEFRTFKQKKSGTLTALGLDEHILARRAKGLV